MTWWLQPGWRETKCACGATIWPEGDPDWGACFTCFSDQLREREGDRTFEAAEDKYWAAKEWASHCAPWFETGKCEASHEQD